MCIRDRNLPSDPDGRRVVNTERLTGPEAEAFEAEKSRARPPTDCGETGTEGGRKGEGEAPTEAPGGTSTDVEAVSRVAGGNVAWATIPAAWSTVTGGEGLVSPNPPTTGASKEEPGGPVPGSVVPERPHHKTFFGVGESFPTPKDGEVDGRARREGAEVCVAVDGE